MAVLLKNTQVRLVRYRASVAHCHRDLLNYQVCSAFMWMFCFSANNEKNQQNCREAESRWFIATFSKNNRWGYTCIPSKSLMPCVWTCDKSHDIKLWLVGLLPASANLSFGFILCSTLFFFYEYCFYQLPCAIMYTVSSVYLECSC